MSRPRSRGSTATPARGARAAGPRGVYVATPKSDVYVALLGVALGAMILASALLAVIWGRYEWTISAK